MDEIQQIKVNELPLAATLTGLEVLGFNATTNEAVRAAITLLKGLDGKPIELQKTTTHIQWRVQGGSWSNLIALSDIKGEKGDTGDTGDTGEKGDQGDTGDTGEVGKSAYQVWLDAGNTGTISAYLDSLKGDKGDTGDVGAKGEKGDTGAKGDPFIYSDFTPEQLALLKGEKGDTGAKGDTGDVGKSAYQVWLDAGNTGTISVYLDSLKGAKGDKGDTGAKGDKGDVGTPNSLSIGTVASGQTPAASITGTAPNQTLNLTLPKGDKGDTGEKGEKGDIGIGVPTGGTTGQQLMKKSNADYDFEWQTPAGAGDMLKSVYDSDGDGVVDNAEKVNNHTVEADVPANAKFTDTVYTHPASHPASIIAETTTKRFVSDEEKSTWNAKSDLALGTTSSTAYRGDRGKTAYDHSQSAHAPSNAQKNSDITKAEIEAKLTGAITTHTHAYAPTSHTHSATDISSGTLAIAIIPTGTTSSTVALGNHTHSNYVPTSRTVAGKALTGNITLAKGDVGLGNVDNTSDANKPVSTAQQTALNAKIDASKFQVVAELPASPTAGVFYFVKE